MDALGLFALRPSSEAVRGVNQYRERWRPVTCRCALCGGTGGTVPITLLSVIREHSRLFVAETILCESRNDWRTSLKYWLMKSEPDCFSIDDLSKAPKKTTF